MAGLSAEEKKKKDATPTKEKWGNEPIFSPQKSEETSSFFFCEK